MADRSDQVTLREGLGVLGRAVRDEPGIFAVAVTGSAVFGAATALTAIVIGTVTDQVIVPAFAQGHTTTAALTVAAMAIVGISVLKAAGIVTRRYFAGVMQYRLQARYRRRVTRQYLRLPLSWHHRHPTGQLLSNANADVEATWYPIAPFPMAVGVLVMLVVAVVAIVLTDPALAAVGLLVFPAILLVNFLYQRRLSPLATRSQALRAELSGVAHESFDGALVVKSLGREAEETARFAAVARELRDANVAVGRVRGAFDPVLEALPSVGVLAVLLVGSARVSAGTLDPGALVSVAYLLMVVAFPIRAIGWVLGELPRAVVGWRRVDRVLSATGAPSYGDVPGGDRDDPVDLRVSDVSFAYDGHGGDRDESHDVLRGVTLDVTPARTVAVVGPTGSGKSTLAALLVRLVDPRTGRVLIDGTDARSLARGAVAGAVALVFQHAFVFEDSVRENVTLGGDFTDDEVWSALRLAQADRFVAALPGGLDSVVGERGATLSGGQRQRLALARAVVRRPRLLVLDDATSAVDPEVERRILAGLRQVAVPATVVVVAYRRATIALADEVVYVEHGRVLARGTHEELLAASAGYRNLLTAYERDAAERAALRADEERDTAVEFADEGTTR
ncbi:MAG TPA: ABC transporter ATP-binding protein [Jiangellaceae bacterium]|nr:ABC transporter ATP-binding protein [Jiangellaceae bacterium]